jgi:hypothetical protein
VKFSVLRTFRSGRLGDRLVFSAGSFRANVLFRNSSHPRNFDCIRTVRKMALLGSKRQESSEMAPQSNEDADKL